MSASISSYLPKKVARTPSPGPPQRGEPPSQRPFSVHLWRAPSVSHSPVPSSEVSSVKPLSLTAEEEKGRRRKRSILGSRLHWATACSSSEHTPPQGCWSSVRCVFSLPSLSLSLSMCWPPSPLLSTQPPITLSPPHVQLFPPFFSSGYKSELHLLTPLDSSWHVFVHTHTSTTSWLQLLSTAPVSKRRLFHKNNNNKRLLWTF